MQAPVGFWDPVGYTRDGDAETFKRRRETEIKHGRVAMYATGSEGWIRYFLSGVSKDRLVVGAERLLASHGNRDMVKPAEATVGYIVPEYFKWPGFLSPSMGLKFSDVPNGLAAIGKVPSNGWAQIVAFAGYYELFVYQYKGEPGAYGWKAISSDDPEVRKRKLNAELANGRLAPRWLKFVSK